MEKKVMSFELFKKTLAPEKVERYKDNALNAYYWDYISNLPEEDFSNLSKFESDSEKKKFASKMTAQEYDAEGFIPAYLEYLEKEGKKYNKTVCLRWATGLENENLDDLERDESLNALGAYWSDNDMTDFNYSDKKKYLHFFPASSYRERKTFLHNIDEEDNPKTDLYAYMIDSDLVEKCTGYGKYLDSDGSYWEEYEEIAIPSSKLKKSNVIQNFEIERTGCQNYNSERHIKTVLNSFYDDDELDDDGYNLNY